jgi:hypothetical protein
MTDERRPLPRCWEFKSPKRIDPEWLKRFFPLYFFIVILRFRGSFGAPQDALRKLSALIADVGNGDDFPKSRTRQRADRK